MDEGPAVNENNHSTMSFDRMRTMLTRAAEIRESEQQQIFDALDEIHARMSPLESLGSVRKRLTELPDRTEVSVLAERLDEALAKLEAQDGAIAGLGRAVEGLVDKLAKPFAQLDGRLDGVGGRFEGVAGRMDGLEDKLSHIHKRLDDVDVHLDRQDGKADQLPNALHGPLRERLEALETALRSRIDEVDEGVHEHLDGTKEALQRAVAETGDGMRATMGDVRTTLDGKIAEVNTTIHDKLDDLLVRPAVDPTDRLESLARRLEQVASRLNDVGGRVDAVEESVHSRIGDLAGTVSEGIEGVHGALAERPDDDKLVSLVRGANEESERRNATQLDEAMATFAELILGGGQSTPPPPPPTALPRPQRRARGPKNTIVKSSDKAVDISDIDLAAEGA
ncbi:MAG: apolipoprotein A1/A4/E family protein [Kutzneria sp.]|nr:apolipoprotein A1/A4/E family protein [Kutzneria sp.]